MPYGVTPNIRAGRNYWLPEQRNDVVEMEGTSSKGKHVDIGELVEFAKDGIVSKTLIKTPKGEISLFCMTAGQLISTHKSSFPAVIHILQGSGEVTLGNKKYQAKPNAWFYMPAQLLHAIEATDNLVFLLTLFKNSKQHIRKG